MSNRFACVLVLAVATSAAATGAAQTCPQAAGRWGYGPAYSVAAAGAHVYFNSGSVLLVADATNPSSVPVVGRIELPDEIMGLAVSGSHVFATVEEVGLRVIDVSQPALPVVVGSLDIPGYSRGVAVNGSHLYLANGWSGLRIIDIGDPTAPTLISTAPTPSFASDVTLLAGGTLAAVAASTAGVRLIDVGSPASPVEVGFLDTPGDCEQVAAAGSLIYVADGGGGLRIVDAATPAAPVELGVFSLGGWVTNDVAVAGTVAYVAFGGAGLRVVDVATPSTPVEIATFATGGSATGIALSGSLAFVASSAAGVHVVDVGTPAAPAGTFELTVPDSTLGVALVGTHAILANGSHGVRVLDVADPAAPAEVGSLETPGRAAAVAASGTFAYVADGSSGLRVVDISTPAAPSLRGSCVLPGSAVDVAVAGTMAYVLESAGLAVVNVSNPNNPTVAGALALSADGAKLAVSGSHAFVADLVAGLRIVSIANPAAPVQVGLAPTPGGARSVAVAGTRVYVGDVTGDLQIIDVTNPAAPAIVGSFADVVTPVDLQTAGSFLYVADHAYGLDVLSLADPAHPERVGSFNTNGTAVDVAVAGTLVAIADSEIGAAFFDVGACPATLCSLACSAAAQPVAGLAPLAVAFAVDVTATQCSHPVAYDWSFGDGSPHATAAAPSHTFASAGSFPWSVTLSSGPEVTTCSGSVVAASAPARRFDFGTATSALASGYTRVTPSSTFGPPGFGWSRGVLAGRERTSGSALTRDFVFTTDATFSVALPAGAYDLTLTIGDAANAHDQMEVASEGWPLDSVTTAAGQFITRTYRADVADGVLDLRLHDLGGSDGNVVVNGLVVTDGAPRRFDFGTPASPVASGYAQVTHTTAYTETRGFGWLSGTISSRDRGTPTNLHRDFNFTPVGTFVVDVANGTYDVVFTMGDATTAHDQMGVYLEGTLVDTVSTAPGSVATRRARTTVADGQLTLTFHDLGGSDANVVVNGVEVYGGATGAPGTIPVADVPKAILDLQTVTSSIVLAGIAGTITDADVTLDITHTYDADLDIFLIGPSGVRVELVTDRGAGGDNFTGTTFDDEAATGIASGAAPFHGRFFPEGSLSLVDGGNPNGTWTLEITDDHAVDEGTLDSWSLTLVTSLAPAPRRFDFGTPTSPLAAGYQRVSHTTAYSGALGYGWLSGPIFSRDRGTGGDLNRDLCFTPMGTFVVDVAPGTYDVTVVAGDATTRHDQMAIEIEGGVVGPLTTLAGQFSSSVVRRTVTDGQLTVLLRDDGGTDANVVINALEIVGVVP